MVVTKGMYTYTLKVTRHLGHFFILLPLPDWCAVTGWSGHKFGGWKDWNNHSRGMNKLLPG